MKINNNKFKKTYINMDTHHVHNPQAVMISRDRGATFTIIEIQLKKEKTKKSSLS